MANVLFKRGNTATIDGTAVTDGQLLYNTTTGQHYIDSDLTRKEVGKPVVNTTAEVSAITADNISCGTKPVKELISNLSKVDGTITVPASSWTNVNTYLYKRDGVAHIRFFGKTTASITANTTALTVDIPPKTDVAQTPTLMTFSGTVTGTIIALNTNGTVVFTAGLAADIFVSFDFEYKC